jgi:2-dehydropantoate 2-reductase
VLGSIIYPAADIASPGVIRHVEGDRISVGEIDGSDTERLRATVKLLRDAGFKVRVSSDLRSELWVKLWGNCTFNPISALTHATLVDSSSSRRPRARRADDARGAGDRREARRPFPVTLEKRIAGAEAVGKHKTSMLQDVEAGRPLELDALVGSVLELGRITGVPTPNLTAVHACVALLAKTWPSRGVGSGSSPGADGPPVRRSGRAACRRGLQGPGRVTTSGACAGRPSP